jgi:ABC-type dipeptide/oligopeptide/nickel transport system ATPase component
MVVPKGLLERLCRESVEAVYRISGALKNLEDMVHSCLFENRRRSRRDHCQFDIAIPLHGCFQAT